MKSRRLTKDDKDQIIFNCLSKISERISEAKESAEAIGIEAVKSLLPRDFKPTAKHENWYAAPSYLYFAHQPTGDVFSVPLDCKVPVPHYMTRGRLNMDNLAPSMYIKLNDARNNLDNLQKQKKELRQICNEVLYGIKTTKQLHELWPDGAEYYALLLEDCPRTALTVPVEKLTQALKQFS